MGKTRAPARQQGMHTSDSVALSSLAGWQNSKNPCTPGPLLRRRSPCAVSRSRGHARWRPHRDISSAAAGNAHKRVEAHECSQWNTL